MRKKNRSFLFLLLICFGVLWTIADIKSHLFDPVPISAAVDYHLQPGTSLRAVAQQLTELRIVQRPLYFIAYARLNRLGTRLQAGEYRIEPGTSVLTILDKMVRGDVQLYDFTIIEGWSAAQLLSALQQHPELQHTLQKNIDPGQVMQLLGKPNIHAEGQFLPDTYLFPKGTTDIDFLKRAHAALQQRLQSEWDMRALDLPLKTPYEALILASIIEKETGQPEERPLIAAVFINRLRKGMRLQTDPTVIYGMGNLFDGNVRLRDLREDTPYNTYTRYGLPPTPIAMPGHAAIYAALHPAQSQALYFVATGGGRHVFSNTLAEHENAVDIYQRRRKPQ
jgi:UPF0755 protein